MSDTILVESAGYKVGNFAKISINGTEVGFGTYTRGLNVAVFDQQTGQVINTVSFDTFLPGNAQQFVNFINSVATGQIVALAVKDDAIANLFQPLDAVVAAFISIGSTQFGNLQFQGSWALIGQKGAPGTAIEQLSPDSPVSVTRSITWGSQVPIPPGSQPPIPITKTRWLEIQRLFADNPDWSSLFGRSVATSGQWVIVGAPLNERKFVGDGGNDFGAAFIFQLQNDGSWGQQQRLQPAELKAADHFGQSVAINGEWAIVGTPYSDVAKPDGGAAYLFHLENGVWNQKDRLAPTDLNNSDLFGYSVSIDGEWAIVSAYLADAPNAGDAGSAYIFHLENGVWVQKQKLQPSDLKASDWFGFSVSINGEWAIVGARYADLPNAGDAGAAYIFHLENGVWVQKPKLQPSDLKASDWFGHSVAINGEWAFVGVPLADNLPGIVDSGAVYVFHLENGVWVQKPKLQPADLNTADYFGNSLTINGNRAVVGAKGLEGIRRDNSGGAYIFQLENGEWKQNPPEYKFIADREDGEYVTGYDANDGGSVALTYWGVALLGAPLTNYRTNASTYGGKGAISQYGSVYIIGQR